MGLIPLYFNLLEHSLAEAAETSICPILPCDTITVPGGYLKPRIVRGAVPLTEPISYVTTIIEKLEPYKTDTITIPVARLNYTVTVNCQKLLGMLDNEVGYPLQQISSKLVDDDKDECRIFDALTAVWAFNACINSNSPYETRAQPENYIPLKDRGNGAHERLMAALEGLGIAPSKKSNAVTVYM